MNNAWCTKLKSGKEKLKQVGKRCRHESIWRAHGHLIGSIPENTNQDKGLSEDLIVVEIESNGRRWSLTSTRPTIISLDGPEFWRKMSYPIKVVVIIVIIIIIIAIAIIIIIFIIIYFL